MQEMMTTPKKAFTPFIQEGMNMHSALSFHRCESIQIFAEIENCSSRMVVPKATIYQTQAFYAKGKMKEVRQLVANLRGESLSSGKTETWNGKQLKIPPVSPSILDCSIIRVEYSLMVYVDIPGAVDLFLNLPLVIGTIPLHPFGTRTSSVSSQGSMDMNWLGLTLPERLEAPPSYAEVVTGENRQSGLAPVTAFDDFQRALQGPLFAYIQEFRFLPPPLYSEPGALMAWGERETRSLCHRLGAEAAVSEQEQPWGGKASPSVAGVPGMAPA
ncbi:arrestin domain-containing protein 3-like isoform X2 [Catharus ustulatus]|uniref:arrestin domain-containing protein 3-like isoform X2 n=1 Tax=Catharus ustulatus TaxID=91951 RepID=UPI00140AC846|nr:arrestin domain-containing protein 3-like isoform X2 [Catharus ustulatus]